MLKYLIQVVQNSLITAILIALFYGVISKSGSEQAKKWLNRGLVTGMLLALTLAVLKHTTVWINREYFNIGILSVAILLEILFFVFSVLPLAGKSALTPEAVWRLISFLLPATWLLYRLPDIYLYPTEFLLAGESVFSTDFLFKTIGFILGLTIVILSALALYQTGSRLPARLVHGLLTAGIAVNLINQVVTVLQPLLARRIIPMQKWLFAIIKFVVNHTNYFLFGILIISAMIPVLLWFRSYHTRQPYANPAEHRKIRAEARRQRRWSSVVLLGFLLSVVSVTFIKTYSEREVVLSPAEPMSIVADQIIIPLEQVNDGHLHRFAFIASDGTEVRFIVIKKNEFAYGVGLDACDICGATGYYERDGKVICKLCDVVMNISTIGFKGGCNPVPLGYMISDGNMVIEAEDLENEKGRFA